MKKQNEELLSWNGKKNHTFQEIKAFYDKISLFPQEILDCIIFYGGTILYIATQRNNVDRCFGDLDVLVPSNKLSKVRKYLESTKELIIQYDGKEVVEKYNIESTDGIQDFGFKGILYGIKLSVHPIGKTTNNEIITKWIKIKDDKIDLIANCTMLNNSSLEEILTKINYNDKKINMIKPEIIIGWKMRRMEGHDEQDIKFVLDHKDVLKVDKNNIEYFKNKMPNYDVSIAYKIVNNSICELGKGIYNDYY